MKTTRRIEVHLDVAEIISLLKVAVAEKAGLEGSWALEPVSLQSFGKTKFAFEQQQNIKLDAVSEYSNGEYTEGPKYLPLAKNTLPKWTQPVEEMAAIIERAKQNAEPL